MGTILVVEDEPSVRALLERVLAWHGHRVVAVASGEAALACLEAWEGPLDLLLTDVVMPGLGGAPLAARVRALRPDVHVIFVTGYAADGELASVAGAVVLEKPFSIDALARVVEDVLARPADGGGTRG